MTDEERISPSNPRVIIAGIRQFGLAADGSDLRDLEAAIDRLSTPPSGSAREIAERIDTLDAASNIAMRVPWKLTTDGARYVDTETLTTMIKLSMDKAIAPFEQQIREKDREIETERARTEWWRIQMKEQVGDANDRTKAAEARLDKAVNVLKEASDILGNEDMPDQIRLECAGWIDSILSEIETKEAAE